MQSFPLRLIFRVYTWEGQQIGPQYIEISISPQTTVYDIRKYIAQQFLVLPQQVIFDSGHDLDRMLNLVRIFYTNKFDVSIEA